MTISELIGNLEAIREREGDIPVRPVCLQHGGFEEWAFHVARGADLKVLMLREMDTFERKHGLPEMPSIR